MQVYVIMPEILS